MKKDATEKKTRQGLSLSPELLAAAKARGGGNLSAYIRGLIERDIAGQGAALDAVSPTILEDLCSKLRPELLEVLKTGIRLQQQASPGGKHAALFGFSQPKALALMLQSLVAYLYDEAPEGWDSRLTLVSSHLLRQAELAAMLGEFEIAAGIVGRMTHDDHLTNPKRVESAREAINEKELARFVAMWRDDLGIDDGSPPVPVSSKAMMSIRPDPAILAGASTHAPQKRRIVLDKEEKTAG